MAVLTSKNTGQLIAGNREDVLDAVFLIGQDEAPIMTKIGKGSKAKGVLHSWITDRIPEPENKNFVEISAYPAAPKSTKQRTSNAVEIFMRAAGVSYDQSASANYGKDEMAHQYELAMKAQAKDVEYRILGLGRSSAVKTAVFMPPQERQDNVTPGKMGGFFYYVSNGETAWDTSGDYGTRGNVLAFDSAKNWSGSLTNVTTAILEEITGKPYDEGARVKDIYVGRVLKAKVNALFARQWVNDKNANLNISQIELTNGIVNVHLHPFLSDKFGLEDVLIAGDFDFAKYAPLLTTIKQVPETETAIKKMLYMSGCLEVRNSAAFSIGVGLK